MRTINDYEKPIDPREIDILGHSLALRMATDGSSDSFWLTPQFANALRWRVDNWKPSLCQGSEAFDNAVKQVAIEALRVYDASHWPAFFAERPEMDGGLVFEPRGPL